MSQRGFLSINQVAQLPTCMQPAATTNTERAETRPELHDLTTSHHLVAFISIRDAPRARLPTVLTSTMSDDDDFMQDSEQEEYGRPLRSHRA
jgi:hypothetical protein